MDELAKAGGRNTHRVARGKEFLEKKTQTPHRGW